MTPKAEHATNRSRQRLFEALLGVFGLIYSIGYLGLLRRWWFEDDPFLYFYAAQIRNPLSIFLMPRVLRHFTTGQAFVPMQLLSYWIDVRLAGFWPAFAYAHQIGSFVLILLLLYLLLIKELRNDAAAAFWICVLWAVLPATAVVLQFLSTRHYLEGLLFSLLSIYVLQRTTRRDKPLQRWSWAVIAAFSFVAMLYKEIYVPVMPGILLFYCWRRRDLKLAASIVILLCVYAFYRFWMVGGALSYGMPYLKMGDYFRFLSKVPYTLTSSYAGYCLYAVFGALCFYYGRGGKRNLVIVLFVLAALLLSLAVVFPVSYALFGDVRTPGPWYRIVFLIHTIALISSGYFVVHSTTRRRQQALLILTLIFIASGTAKTRRVWIQMTASAEREGKFYLNNPDKVLLSEQAASWFIPGVHAMYGVQVPHYVLVKDLKTGDARLPLFVWRFRDGEFVPDYLPAAPVQQKSH